MAIRFPECPRCKTKIRRCTRYTPIINHVHNLIAKVKQRILGDYSPTEIEQRRKHVIKDFDRTQDKLQEMDHASIQMFHSILNNEDDFFSGDIITLMENIMIFFKEISLSLFLS